MDTHFYFSFFVYTSDFVPFVFLYFLERVGTKGREKQIVYPDPVGSNYSQTTNIGGKPILEF